MKTRKVIQSYVLLAFVISYLIGLVWAFIMTPFARSMGLENGPISQWVLKFGPSLAGIITCYIYYGAKGTIKLLKSGLNWRANTKVIAITILMPLLFITISLAIWANEQLVNIYNWSTLSILSSTFILKLFLGGGFGEEFGWRGFMQPNLENKFTWVKASLIVAFVWILWHLPVLFLGGSIGNPIVFIATLSGYSVIMAWIYNATKSVLWVAIFHGWTNALSNTLENTIGDNVRHIETYFNFTYAALIVCFAILLLITTYKKNQKTSYKTVYSK